MMINLIKIKNNRYNKAINSGFVIATPSILLGSLALLAISLPIPGYSALMANIFGLQWQKVFLFIIEMTFLIAPLFFVVGVSFSLAGSFSSSSIVGLGHYKGFMAVILSLSVFMLFLVTFSEGYISFKGGRITSLAAIIIALLTTKVFYFISSRVSVSQQFYSDTTSVITQKVFKNLLASLLTLMIALVVRLLYSYSGASIYGFIANLINSAFLYNTDVNLFKAVHYTFLKNIIWFFSYNANNALATVDAQLFNNASNQTIYNAQFFHIFLENGGNASVLSFVIAIFIYQAKQQSRKKQDKLFKIISAPAFFNINESVLYGFPLVLNPFFIIPLVMVPVINLLTATLFLNLGLVAMPLVDVPSTVPTLLSGYLSSGSISTALMQAINLCIGVFVYYPFIVFDYKVSRASFRHSQQALVKKTHSPFLLDDYYFTKQTGAMGSVARILCAELKVALQKEQLYLQYQPKVLYKEQKIFGFEALIRWNHSDYGFIPPPVIVALAEEGGLLAHMGVWVAKTAANQLKTWHDMGYTELTMAINLSAKELQDKAIAQKVAKIVKGHQLNNGTFEVEITENMELAVSPKVQKSLDIFTSSKIPLAIDDFGMGHSSAVYLKIFDINTLKIDRSISYDILEDERLKAILTSVVLMCQQLDTMVVVEFVETKEQLDYLVSVGCNVFQGYLFSRPLSASDATLYIQETLTAGKLIYAK